MKIIALVPIKENSTRLENKNFLLFDGIPLYQIVLKKLEENQKNSEIIVNTDSKEIKTTAPQLFSKVKIIDRPKKIGAGDITMNTIINLICLKLVESIFYKLMLPIHYFKTQLLTKP